MKSLVGKEGNPVDIKNNRNDDATFYRFDSKLFYIIRKYNGSGVANVNQGDS